MTTTTALLLCSIYGAYAGLVTPLLAPARLPRPAVSQLASGPVGPPRENRSWAEQCLPDWAATAHWQGRWGSTFFFAGRQINVEDNGVVRCAPFALIHTAGIQLGDERPPIVILAESALVRFPDTMDVSDPDPRSAMGCALDGAVQVTGPDGLVVMGGNFVFERSTMQVRSEEAVRLAWRTHQAQARGLEVVLRSPESPDADQGPIKTLRLYRNVRLKLSFPSRPSSPADHSGPVETREDWVLQSEGRLEIDPSRLTASLEQNVRVQRPTTATTWDRLQCRRLLLRFAPADTTGPVQQRPTFAGLEAVGEPVTVDSTQHQLKAQAAMLGYDVSQRRIEMSGSVIAGWGLGRLQCDQLMMTRGLDGRIERAVCRGTGSLTWKQAGTPPVPVTARWSRQLRLSPEPGTGLDIVELDGKPLIRYGSDSALSAESIKVWFQRTALGVEGTEKTDEPTQFALQLKRLTASQQVGAISPQAYVATSRLAVSFEPSDGQQRSADRQLFPWPGQGRQAAPASGDEDRSDGLPAVISAETIRARLGLPADRPGLDLLEAVTEGNVRVFRQGRGESGEQLPYELRGDRVQLVNSVETGERVSIDGRPARLWSGLRAISGRRITLEPASGRGLVEGQGTMTLPVKRDPSGAVVSQAIPLQVSWTERLSLAGQTLTFLGDVAAEWLQKRLNCAQMEVTLTGAPGLGQDSTDWKDIEVQALRCRHVVRVHDYSYKDKALASVLKSRMADLWIDVQTGELQTGGPGWIELWRKGQPRQAPLAPTAIARANTPLALNGSRWQYLRIDFSDVATGNIYDLHATFHEQVQVVQGLVTGPQESIDADRLGRDDGWLRCDSLQVTQTSQADDSRTFTLLANGDSSFSGQAAGQTFFGRADTVSYDESRHRYVLRSFGQAKATLWRKTRGGGPFIRAEAQRVEYSPRDRQLVLDRTTEVLKDRN